MRRLNTFLRASSAVVVLTAGLAMAQGIVPDRSTVVTISAPVSVPGVVLPAGEYLFRLADSQASRNVVQIYDKDRTKIFATLLAIPAERNEPTGEAVITFRESPANQAPALRYWYYAGEKSGQEFAYPKNQAIQIARASGESVMAMDASGDDMDAMKKAEMHRIEANSPEVTAAAESNAATTQAPAAESQAAASATAATASTTPAATPAEPAATPTEPQASTAAPATPAAAPAESAPAATPAPAEPQTPAAAPAEPAAAAPVASSEPQPTGTSGRADRPAPSTAGTSGSASAAATDAPRELPATASELPLVGVLGFLALGAAFGARALRRRMVV
jgi:hypothetical protein